ncbi:MAG: exodeoxyribonuclease VII large subunit [Candidatus Aenigmarchaeota archaeon]|nr:exodeoxyribonuclease VII large subunit [Candidatus Aenigmarchaeota archaeon]
MKERQLKIFCIAGSILSLAALYIFVLAAVSEDVSVCDLSTEHMGKTVTVSGTVSAVSESNGNIFFTLSDSGCEIDVVLWDSVRRALEQKMNVSSVLSLNRKITVTGPVEIHRGLLQIVPGRPEIKPTP